VPAEAIREFVRRIGVARANSLVDVAMFEHAVREVLNRGAPRRLAVLRPLKVVITNTDLDTPIQLEARNHPDDPTAGTRDIPFGGELYVERDDFMEDPPKNFYRLALGRTVRLRYAGLVTCHEVMKDPDGQVIELRCTWHRESTAGTAPDGTKVRGTIHWVSAAQAQPAEIRLYHPLFTRPDPGADGDLMADLNPNSLETLAGAMVEPGLAGDNSDAPVQFERQGYFYRDPDSAPGKLVFNRTIGLPENREVIAMRFLRASVQGGATAGGMLGPHYFQGPVHMPGRIADFPTAMDYASKQGWVEKLPNQQYRLTNAGYRIGNTR
jgi:glutaminyl-tRNA synthetase